MQLARINYRDRILTRATSRVALHCPRFSSRELVSVGSAETANMLPVAKRMKGNKVVKSIFLNRLESVEVQEEPMNFLRASGLVIWMVVDGRSSS